MTSLPQIALKQIRQHESSQQRAWEELAYILIPDIESLPAGTILERRAAPDGGVEFSCPSPTGKGRWAWQAKFLFRLTASAFGQMTRSVTDALNSTKDITRYTFVLPTDRTTGELPKWETKIGEWAKLVTAKNTTVEFGFVGESDTITALAVDKHAGAVRYFFDETLLTDDFFRHHVDQQVHNLGDRYDPEVHVEIEFADVLDALCRTPAFVTRILGLFDEIQRRERVLAAPPAELGHPTEVDATRAALDALSAIVRAWRGRVGMPDVHVLARFESSTQDCSTNLEKLDACIRGVLATLRQDGPPADATSRDARQRGRGRGTTPARAGTQKSPTDALYEFQGALWALRRALEQASYLLTSVQATSATRGALIVDGAAGCGKSHVLADVASARAATGMPTVLVLGQHLAEGPIWPQITAEIGLDLTGSEFLAALEVAGRVRGTGRALIAIDAINEGAGAQLWYDHLAGFLVEIAAHPWVGVVLTIRDTYVESVLPGAVAQDVSLRVTHPGLAGHEEGALHLYAQHYRLRLPDIPSLLPELTNPLFLRSLCRSVKQRGLTAIPREAMGLAWVFDGLIQAVNGVLSHRRRLDVDPADDLVGSAVSALADAMLDVDDESLPVDAAKAICLALHPEQRRSKSLFEGLIAEGLLLRERVRSDGGDRTAFVDQVRFTYQRLADHLRAEAVLVRHPENADLAMEVRSLVANRVWSRAGLIEALVLVVPERRNIELATLLRLGPRATDGDDDEAGEELSIAESRKADLRRALGRAFFAALPWRDPVWITDKTRELANRYLQAGTIGNEEWLALLLTLACVPEHPFNVHLLDRALRRWTLPERDEFWSDAVLGVWSEDATPIGRTIDFVWSDRYTVPDDVARLAGTTLAWLLTSPNRRLRDTATKALLRLVEHRTTLLTELIDAFAEVDDPYVIERLVAVASGHAIRHRHVGADEGSLDDLTALAKRVFDLVFAGPVPEHLLIRAYARACVESASATLDAHGRQLDRDIAAAKPPYGAAWPLRAPSVRELARRYGGRSRSSITGATEIGYDFAHYVIERGIAEDFALPNQARRRAQRQARQRRKIQALREDIATSVPVRRRVALVAQLDGLIAARQHSLTVRDAWEEVWNAELAVAEKSRELELLVWALAGDAGRPVRPDAGLLTRWIAQRVLDLGWSRKRFGERDAMLGRARSHRWTETERFAKKYSWIAFYQLLGHLADHGSLQEEWRDAEPERYEGPWQVSHGTDIDPTVVLRSDVPPEGTPAARLREVRVGAERNDAWWLAPYLHSLHVAGDDAEWLKDTGDVPEPGSLLSVVDPQGREWLVLESHAAWSVPFEAPRRSDTPRRQLWVRTHANLVRLDNEAGVGKWAATKNWMGLWIPTPTEYRDGCLHAYPDLIPWPSNIERTERERRGDESTLANGWEMARCQRRSKTDPFPPVEY